MNRYPLRIYLSLLCCLCCLSASFKAKADVVMDFPDPRTQQYPLCEYNRESTLDTAVFLDRLIRITENNPFDIESVTKILTADNFLTAWEKPEFEILDEDNRNHKQEFRLPGDNDQLPALTLRIFEKPVSKSRSLYLSFFTSCEQIDAIQQRFFPQLMLPFVDRYTPFESRGSLADTDVMYYYQRSHSNWLMSSRLMFLKSEVMAYQKGIEYYQTRMAQNPFASPSVLMTLEIDENAPYAAVD